VVGDPEDALAELLWSRVDELNRVSGLNWLLDVIIDSAELNPGRAHDWAVVRCVDYWLLGLEHGLALDAARYQHVLEALA
jgi:hypothetical protein